MKQRERVSAKWNLASHELHKPRWRKRSFVDFAHEKPFQYHNIELAFSTAFLLLASPLAVLHLYSGLLLPSPSCIPPLLCRYVSLFSPLLCINQEGIYGMFWLQRVILQKLHGLLLLEVSLRVLLLDFSSLIFTPQNV
ncbi:expressed protein [Arabidopsis lyrata subsp. lyrata]|uniref:Expressed protein n=1 Tax=Arabidopsis lyrata subsp. lyrata TaxID=81972 RepID=D7KZU1_ARALL|nr:expressed protein [Arabidopsis lyrata subsp. lyrata]